MTIFDTCLLLILLSSLVVGWRKGLIKQAASLVSWVLGIVITLFLREPVTQLYLAINPDAANWPLAGVTVQTVALAVTFLVITLIIRVVAYLLRKAVKVTHMGCLDRASGAALFAFKYIFILSIVLNLLFALRPTSSTFTTEHALNNKPYEFTLDLMPRLLGAEKLPSDSLKVLKQQAALEQQKNE